MTAVQQSLRGRKYHGLLTKSEFKLRCGFIRKRIEKRLLREEIAFLLGRNLYLVNNFEELQPGIRFDAKDTKVLSLILAENQDHLLKPDPLDLDYQAIIGIKSVSNEKLYYELNHNWNDTDDGTTVIDEVTRNYILSREMALLKKTIKEVERLIESGYFDTSQSGLAVYRLMQKVFSNDIRPIVIKKAIYFSIQEKKLISYRKEGYFRYRKNGLNRFPH